MIIISDNGGSTSKMKEILRERENQQEELKSLREQIRVLKDRDMMMGYLGERQEEWQ